MPRAFLTLLALSAAVPVAHAGDREALVGTWAIIVFQDNGRDRLERLGAGPPRKGVSRVAKLVVTKDAVRALRGDGRREERAGLANAAWKSITLDESTLPKSIDIVGIGGKDVTKPKTYVGAYALEGGKLTICWCEQGSKRPTKLESDGANNLFVCERLSGETDEPKAVE